MNKRNAQMIIDAAIENGTVSIFFDKFCRAGGCGRRFSGAGSLTISLENNNMRICGEGGFIALVPVASRQEAADYIAANFYSMSLRYASMPAVAVAMA